MLGGLGRLVVIHSRGLPGRVCTFCCPPPPPTNTHKYGYTPRTCLLSEKLFMSIRAGEGWHRFVVCVCACKACWCQQDSERHWGSMLHLFVVGHLFHLPGKRPLAPQTRLAVYVCE